MNTGWRLGLWIQLTSMPGHGQHHGFQEDPSKWWLPGISITAAVSPRQFLLGSSEKFMHHPASERWQAWEPPSDPKRTQWAGARQESSVDTVLVWASGEGGGCCRMGRPVGSRRSTVVGKWESGLGFCLGSQLLPGWNNCSRPKLSPALVRQDGAVGKNKSPGSEGLQSLSWFSCSLTKWSWQVLWVPDSQLLVYVVI